MSNNQPATLPADGTTPGSDAQGTPNPSVQNPPASPQGSEGTQPEGQVTISTKEYAQLQRDGARLKSFQKRVELKTAKKSDETTANLDPEDQVVQALNETRSQNQSLAAELFSEKVANRTRDILAKDEYKSLPQSTKELILRDPSILSKADNVEEAVLDVEDFVREQVAAIPADQPAPAGQPAPEPEGHQTPTSVNAGVPAQADSSALESLEGKTGTARSRAALRNAIKQKKGVTNI